MFSICNIGITELEKKYGSIIKSNTNANRVSQLIKTCLFFLETYLRVSRKYRHFLNINFVFIILRKERESYSFTVDRERIHTKINQTPANFLFRLRVKLL